MDLRNEIEKIAFSLGKYSEQILESWEVGEPIKNINFDKLKVILINPDLIKKTIDKIRSELYKRNYSGIYCIIGEAGSGKSQIAFLIQQELYEHNVKTYYFRIAGQKDINEIIHYFENLEGKNVVFIDEIDSLLGSVDENEKKKIVDRLGNILTLYAEGSKDGKRIATILLLSRRSYETIRRLDERLWRRIKRFDIPSDYERLRSEHLPSLMKNILAIIYSSRRELFPKERISDILTILIDWGSSYLERITEIGSVGMCIKTLLEAYIKILEELDKDFKLLDDIEEGKRVEQIIKEELLNKSLNIIRFELGKKTYTAKIIECDLPSGYRPDLCYGIYPGQIPTGKPKRKVYVEIKCGYYKSLKDRKDQLMKYIQLGPLLIIWIFKGEENKIEELINELGKSSPNPVDYISLPYELVRPAIYLNDPIRFLKDLGIKGDIEMKIRSSLEGIEVSPVGVPVKESPIVEDLSERYKKIAIMLVNKLKPDQYDGKLIQVGKVRNLLVQVAQTEGIPMDKRTAEAIAVSILSKLQERGFVNRDKPTTRNFHSRLGAWKTRREEGIEIISEVLTSMLKK
jgi:hypothetical protein